ncbi:MAG: hypothetical protein ACWGNV_16725, partial [Bacteroidales bacterium]
MKRRVFFRTAGTAALLAGAVPVLPRVAPHNWDGYDFGPRPAGANRLNQGPFSAYGPDATAPGADVVMITGPSLTPVRNPGMGLVTYLCDEAGPPNVPGEPLEQSMEELAAFPLGDKLYLRVDWRDIQQRPGRLDFPDHWKIAFDLAARYGKKVGFRIQLMSPVIEGHSMPEFLSRKVPFVELGTTDQIGLPGKVHAAPRYDHPEFQAAFRELDDLLSDLYNGHELVEFADTSMYGFWGEGHTWPFDGNPFPDYHTAEQTFIGMFEYQAGNWDRTPLLTNTQPDYSNVGNSEVLDRTVRTHNWLRTDTIFIENEQIEALSNRPPWTGALVENGISAGEHNSEHIIQHAGDVGPHYFSLWNWHRISARNLKSYYAAYPEALDSLSGRIGYRIRPSWIWHFEREGYPTLIFGLVNDGIAAVPGVLRLTLKNSSGESVSSGTLDAGYPLPGKVRQAALTLPKEVKWEGLRLYAGLEVKSS